MARGLCFTVCTWVLAICVATMGIVLIVVPSIAVSKFKYYGGFSQDKLYTYVVFVLGYSVAAFVFGGILSCMILCNNTCSLITRCFIAAALSLIAFAGGITGFVFHYQFWNIFPAGMDELYSKYETDAVAQSAVHYLQNDYKCCGPNGKWPLLVNPPESCTDHAGVFYTLGCNEAWGATLRTYVLVLSLFMFFISFFYGAASIPMTQDEE